MQDCSKALRSFGVVYEIGGAMVPELANRNGHRNIAAGRNTAGWGGIRLKKLVVAEIGRWLHEHAIDAKNGRTTQLLVQLAGEDISSDEEE